MLSYLRSDWLMGPQLVAALVVVDVVMVLTSVLQPFVSLPGTERVARRKTFHDQRLMFHAWLALE